MRWIAASALSCIVLLAAACSSDEPASKSEAEPTTSPTPVARPQRAFPDGADDNAAFNEFAQRLLSLPEMTNGEACPVSSLAAGWPTDFTSGGLGDGPVYPVLPPLVELRPNNPAVKTIWVSEAKYQGPALVRGRQLDGMNQMAFQHNANPKPSAQHRLPSRGSATSLNQPEGWRQWPSATLVDGPGCYAVQIDGEGFSVVVVFKAVICETPGCSAAS